MKISTYSLKTGIFLTLVLILALAMILLDIVVIRMTEKDLLRAEIRRGKVILSFFEQTLIAGSQEQITGRHGTVHPLHRNISELINEGLLSAALILDHSGDILLETAVITEAKRKTLLNLAESSLRRGRDIVSTPHGAFSLPKGGIFFWLRPYLTTRLSWAWHQSRYPWRLCMLPSGNHRKSSSSICC